jgi:tetratricopeptide (TPR) repeat protein
MNIANNEIIIKEEIIMKTKSILKRHFIIMSLSVAVACMSFVLWSCVGQELDKTVQQAYELRINGQADSAKVLLEQIIAEDSTNAAAWYELARTKHHMGLGNPMELISGMVDIQQTVQNAVDIDPDNVIYQYYKGCIDYFNLYIGLQMGKENVSEDFAKVVESYKSVLILKPDYHEAKLFLVELFAMLPSNMGGDSAKAEMYVRELEEADVVSGAKAREIVMPEDADYIEFWQKIEEKQMDNADVHEALGKVYLYHENIEEATKCFETAISLNAKKNILYVDLGRYYTMQAMQNPAKLDSLAPLIKNTFETYLESQPEPINPLKAFVIGNLARIEFNTGDNENGEKLNKEAMALDPNYSKAFGTPSQILFDPPDEISRVHVYFFRPF